MDPALRRHRSRSAVRQHGGKSGTQGESLRDYAIGIALVVTVAAFMAAAWILAGPPSATDFSRPLGLGDQPARPAQTTVTGDAPPVLYVPARTVYLHTVAQAAPPDARDGTAVRRAAQLAQA